MEKIGHFLDEEVQAQFEKYKDQFSNKEVSDIIENELTWPACSNVRARTSMADTPWRA